MNSITNFQERVDETEQAFRDIDDQHSGYNERLIELIDSVKGGLRQKLAEMSRNQIQYERMTLEYQQLSDMLHSLVATVETGGRSRVRHLIHDLDLPSIEAIEQSPAEPGNVQDGGREALPDDDAADDSLDNESELMDYVDSQSFRDGMQRVLKKKGRGGAAKAAELSEAPPAT